MVRETKGDKGLPGASARTSGVHILSRNVFISCKIVSSDRRCRILGIFISDPSDIKLESVSVSVEQKEAVRNIVILKKGTPRFHFTDRH